MDENQIQSLIKQLKATGLGEEEIMDAFYETFKEGKMDRKDLETLAEAMGYELTDDFKNDPQKDPIASGEGGMENPGDMSKEQLEDAKEIDPGETAEEFKEKLEGNGGDDAGEDSNPDNAENEVPKEDEDKGEEAEDGEDKPDNEDSDGEEDSDSDEKEWEEASKKFGW